MKAPKEIYIPLVDMGVEDGGIQSAPIWWKRDKSTEKQDCEGVVKYIRADLAEQPETDLLEEAYMRGFAQGAKEEREAFIPLINRLCEAILFEWKDVADLAWKIRAQIKEREEK